MAVLNGGSDPLTFRSGCRVANRLVSLGYAVVLVGTQIIWIAFLGWMVLHFLR
jgi:hypothetical protein